jgi:hypothetical protein
MKNSIRRMRITVLSVPDTYFPERDQMEWRFEIDVEGNQKYGMIEIIESDFMISYFDHLWTSLGEKIKKGMVKEETNALDKT